MAIKKLDKLKVIVKHYEEVATNMKVAISNQIANIRQSNIEATKQNLHLSLYLNAQVMYYTAEVENEKEKQKKKRSK